MELNEVGDYCSFNECHQKGILNLVSLFRLSSL